MTDKPAKPKGAPAYRLVDVSVIPEDSRQEVLDDAAAGGGLYGLEVVEVVMNGPAQLPVYGVYDHNEEKWSKAQSDLGFSDAGGASGEALTQAAAAKAAQDAAAAKAAEDAAVNEVVPPAAPTPTATKATTTK